MTQPQPQEVLENDFSGLTSPHGRANPFTGHQRASDSVNAALFSTPFIRFRAVLRSNFNQMFNYSLPH